MDKKDWIEGLLFAGFRIVALVCMLAGLLSLLFQLLDAWYAFDPNYVSAFFMSVLMRPLILTFAGLILHFLAGALARRAAARFTRPGS